MQTVTAGMCMALLALVDVPAHVDGVFISIPTGYFEVAAACAGVEFLIAMIAYGALVANTCFRSPWRRASFMAAAIVVPIIANGIRAWGTIYISHLTSSDFALGFDHVIYGWIFFAIVVLLLMAVSWRWFDRRLTDPWFDPRILQPGAVPPATWRKLLAIAAATLAVATLPILWSAAIVSSSIRPVPANFDLPHVAGWKRVPMQGASSWRPHFVGADTLQFGRYRDAAGHEVDLAIVVFDRQEEGKEIVAFGQGAITPGGDWTWTASGLPPPSGKLDRIASFGTVREVATFYRVGSILTGSGLEVKLETMKTRLFGGPQRAVAILVSAEAPAAGASPRPAIDEFLRDLGPLDRIADRAAGLD
jgi:EpsI family protein